MDRKTAENNLRLRVHNIGSEEHRKILDEVASMVIRDKLVDPKNMCFDVAGDPGYSNDHLRLTYMLPPKNESVTIHSHALGQLADKSRPTKDEPAIMRKQMWDLHGGKRWHKELLAHMFNVFYSCGEFVDRRKNQGKFLHRLVGTELRGFLSRSYNRNLNTTTSLRTFLEACSRHGAGPLSASSTAVRIRLTCALPQVFEPIPGEFIAFGVTYGNSDFGAGTLSISNMILRLNSVDFARGKYGYSTSFESAFSRTHLGSVIQESEIELSDATAIKEVEAVNSAIQDVVNAQFNIDSVEKVLEAIRIADREEIPWKTVQELLSSVLSRQDVETAKGMLEMGVQDLPQVYTGVAGVTTGWWAANLIGWFAEKETDADKKAKLQDIAGSLIMKKAI